MVVVSLGGQKVRLSNSYTNLGILQGDVLAPLIFIMVLEFILRLSVSSTDGIKIGAITLADLEFADDIATVTDSLMKNTQL